MATAVVACDRRTVVLAAGACAETLCNRRIGETIDPDRVAKATESHFDDFLRQQGIKESRGIIVL